MSTSRAFPKLDTGELIVPGTLACGLHRSGESISAEKTASPRATPPALATFTAIPFWSSRTTAGKCGSCLESKYRGSDVSGLLDEFAPC